ncbi:hypothetical protein [Pleionea sp. CnH1-48]|uniref:hypothetical protein n=1 Tax=Pleionea sp. CnH1-48 TaxID=2954494 RepID=UPI00209775E3|nr:hypothetical protein [Pleionea sp. CnH1-48]MCO7226267.1 hypothetical protein [Pleionea sp. CnH1-48]
MKMKAFFSKALAVAFIIGSTLVCAEEDSITITADCVVVNNGTMMVCMICADGQHCKLKTIYLGADPSL